MFHLAAQTKSGFRDMDRLIQAMLTLLVSMTGMSGWAEQTLPRWEAGIGVGSLLQADYPGADRSDTYTALFPFGIYRSARYTVDRGGVRGSLVGGESWGLGLSGGARAPVDSDDNPARRGMDDIDAQFELGPNLQWQLGRLQRGYLQLELPLRAVISLEDGRSLGTTMQPKLVYRQRWREWRAALSAGWTFGSQRYHEQFYSVLPAEVTAQRRAYRAHAGQTNSRISLSLSHRFKQHLFGFFVVYSNYDSARNEGGDLLLRDNNINAGFVYTVMLAASKHRISIDDAALNAEQ